MKTFKNVLFMGVLCLPTLAHADDYKVYSPRIEQGEKALEANLNMDFDHRDEKNHYVSQVIGGEYAPTPYWKTELSGEIEKDPHDSNKLTNLKWENVISPWKAGENWVDTGLYVELEKGAHNDDPNNFETKLLLEKDTGKWTNTANLKLQHEFGPNHEEGWGSGMAVATRYRYDKTFEPGIEYYGDFGNFKDDLSFNEQNHQIGPVVQGKIGPVRYDTGVLAGISKEAPDATAKLNLEYEF